MSCFLWPVLAALLTTDPTIGEQCLSIARHHVEVRGRSNVIVRFPSSADYGTPNPSAMKLFSTRPSHEWALREATKNAAGWHLAGPTYDRRKTGQITIRFTYTERGPEVCAFAPWASARRPVNSPSAMPMPTEGVFSAGPAPPFMLLPNVRRQLDEMNDPPASWAFDTVQPLVRFHEFDCDPPPAGFKGTITAVVVTTGSNTPTDILSQLPRGHAVRLNLRLGTFTPVVRRRFTSDFEELIRFPFNFTFPGDM